MNHNTYPPGYQCPPPPPPNPYHQSSPGGSAPSPPQNQYDPPLGRAGSFSLSNYQPMPPQDNLGRGPSPAPTHQSNSYFPPPTSSQSAPLGSTALPVPSHTSTPPSVASDHHAYGQSTQSWQQSTPWQPTGNHQHQHATPGSYGQQGHGYNQPPSNIVQVTNQTQPPQQQQRPQSLQRMSLSSLSGKKTTAWLKKNVSPHLTEVAKNSLVKGSIKELGNAYTAAKVMGAKYSSPPASNYNMSAARPSDANQSAQPWSPAHVGIPSPPVHQQTQGAATFPPAAQHQSVAPSYSPPAKQRTSPATYNPPVQQQSVAAAYSPPVQQHTIPASYSPPVHQYLDPAAHGLAGQQHQEGSYTPPSTQQHPASPPYSSPSQQQTASSAQGSPAQQYQAPPYTPPVQQQQEINTPLHQAQETAAYNPATVSPPAPIARKPVAAVQRQNSNRWPVSQAVSPVTPILPADAADRSQGYILSIDHERKKAIRFIPGPDGNDRYVVEDLLYSRPSEAPAELAPSPHVPSYKPVYMEHTAAYQEPVEMYAPPPPQVPVPASVPETISAPVTAPVTAEVSQTVPAVLPVTNPAPVPTPVTTSVFTSVPAPQTYDVPPSTVDQRDQDLHSSPPTSNPPPRDHTLVPPPLFGAAYTYDATRDSDPAAVAPPSVPTKTGFMSKLISAVSQIQLADPPGHATSQTYRMEIDDPAYEPLAFSTPVTTTGTPNSPLRVCPQTRTVKYSTTWYHLKGSPEFDICSWCFNKYVSSSSLTHEFENVVKSGVSCRFNVPRVTKTLWPEAQRIVSVDPLRNFISRRVTIPACTKAAGAVGTDGVKWFGLATGELGMVACEACHEDIVLGTSFAGRFCPLKEVQGTSDRWTCTLSYDYVSRAPQALSKRSDLDAAWGQFIEAATKRMGLPQCDGTESIATRCNWYRPKQPVANLDFCEACYLDKLAMTPYANDFADTAEGFEEKLCMRSCDLQLINLGECIHVARVKSLGIDVILKAAAQIASSPRCFKSKGITDGKFYNFNGGAAANFGVCEACYAGILVPHGVDTFFAPEPQLVAGTAWCAFNPSLSRFNGLVDSWLEASETGVWGTYETWVRKYAALPVCPNFNLAANSKWYGWQDCTICPECFEVAAEGTSLVSSMDMHNVVIEGETLCCMYSDRMRGKYKEACEAGDATELRAFCRKRWETYQQTVPRFKMLAEMQSMQSAMAMSNMMLSMSYQHANAMSDWVSPSGHEYGNSSVGYHSSQYGVDSAEAWNKGQAGFAQARGGVAEASYLKDIWQAVE